MNMKRQVPCRWKPPPLTNSSSQIRLLWIYAGKEDEEIRCTVSVWDLEHAPRFRAISYTWGSPQPTAFIKIQSLPSRPSGRVAARLYDMRVRVRENARYALWQARLHYPDSYIWIDSACINQTDLREKTAQVTMMAKIYARAVAVLACIGPSDKSSDFIYEACEYLASVPRRAPDVQRVERLQAFMGARPVDVLKGHFEKFSSRSYFHRLWILQELHSGRAQLMLCGNLVTALSHIDVLERLLHDDRCCPQDEDWYVHIGTLIEVLRVRPISYANSAWRVLDRFLCEDARDRVYGVLEMIDWDAANIKKPLPDYEMSLFDLAVKLIPRKDVVYETTDLKYLAGVLGLDELGTSDLIHEFKASRPLELPADFAMTEWKFDTHAICPVGQDHCGRLCADLSSRVVTEFESADEAVRLLESEIQLDESDDIALPSSNRREPVRIYTAGTVSVVAWPEVRPGDILVQIANQVLVGRIIDTSHFRVVGYALVLSSFDWKGWEDWTCECWTEKFGEDSRFGVILSSTDMSHTEAVVLSTKSSDGFNLSSRVKRLRLSIPAIGSVFEDTTHLYFGIRPIKETCALHNAEECNKWLEYPMRFTAASGCGAKFQRARII